MKRTVFLLALLLIAACTTPAQVAIIANNSVPANSIDMQTLARIYKLEQTKWPNGNTIHVFALKRGTASVAMFHEFIGIDPLYLKKLWLRIQLTGEGQAPMIVGEDEIVDRVAETPGSIGFVQADRVTESVKVLRKIE
jgi:ABC-type phosphate transport system substrate-binding protein